MGQVISYVQYLFEREKTTYIYVVGHYSGVTEFLSQLHLDPIISQPTLYRIEMEGVEIIGKIFDSKRHINWGEILKNAHGIVYIFNNSKNEFLKHYQGLLTICNHAHLRHVPILILPNDTTQNAVKNKTVDDIVEYLEQDKFPSKYWFVQNVNTSTGEGMYQGLEWLLNVILYK